MTDDVLLRVRGLSKSFGAVNALRDASFELRRGEIHGLAGENGAGKSTLMNVIDGILQPDAGEIEIDGAVARITSPTVAQKLGIGFLHQEIALCPDVSIAENIFMATTNSSGAFLMNYKDLRDKARQMFGRLSAIDPATLVRDLSISEQQLVEIAKALTLDCRILILDEPTASLTEGEARILFAIMHRLSRRGISQIYISHRLVEIFEHCDRVTVFRDGRSIMTRTIAETSATEIVNAMVGRVLDKLYPDKQSAEERSDEVILSVRNLTERRRFRNISFDLRKGEILGIAGLIGAGRSEIVKGICRLEGEVTGEVVLGGVPLSSSSYRDSVLAGLVYLSEDRKGDGVFLDLSIAANVSALRIEQVASRLGLIDPRREAGQARALGARLNLKCGSVADPASSLSGGNQQKVALAKLLSVKPRLIFLDEPTRGVDVGAKAEIHRILRQLAREGVGIVLISSEMPELIGLCDRLIVIHEGEMMGEVTAEGMTEQTIMHLASGLQPRENLAR
jgi:ribose transport system ATP-binding protein